MVACGQSCCDRRVVLRSPNVCVDRSRVSQAARSPQKEVGVMHHPSNGPEPPAEPSASASVAWRVHDASTFEKRFHPWRLGSPHICMHNNLQVLSSPHATRPSPSVWPRHQTGNFDVHVHITSMNLRRPKRRGLVPRAPVVPYSIDSPSALASAPPSAPPISHASPLMRHQSLRTSDVRASMYQTHLLDALPLVSPTSSLRRP